MTMVRKRRQVLPNYHVSRSQVTEEESRGHRPPPPSTTIRSPNMSWRMSSDEEAAMVECCRMALGGMWITDNCCISLRGGLVGDEDEDMSPLPSGAKTPPEEMKKLVICPCVEVVRRQVQWEGLRGDLVVCRVVLKVGQCL
eukprot:Gb_15718 [translate_table: standard]